MRGNYIDFYTKRSKYTVSEDSVFKDGECIAAGQVTIIQLLQGEESYLSILENEYIPPTILKTERVEAVLPSDEHLAGVAIRKRYESVVESI
ncbi:hypothetical protein [Desertibacillus haloalkaliphilus]|uniref:hypothetical protein n=1 Tax=Desertibacillus haloalkaliphilus TaxID=1328930 RepID=UPI001C27B46F|nr:hypothetical protein [Desertibacillus haloalkaliphilus]MBU8908186.1 hypothetical protein [Desertibacillus haloalkaliphilus]